MCPLLVSAAFVPVGSLAEQLGGLASGSWGAGCRQGLPGPVSAILQLPGMCVRVPSAGREK